MLSNLLSSSDWPPAVLPKYICDLSEDSKLERASAIFDNVLFDDIYDKKILDFGCGEGHCVKLASLRNKK